MNTKDILISLGLAAAAVLAAVTLSTRANNKTNLKVNEMSNRLASSEKVNLTAAVSTLENKLMAKGGDLEAQINELKKTTGTLEAKAKAANDLISSLDTKTTQVNSVLAQAIKTGTKEIRTDALGAIENQFKAERQAIENQYKINKQALEEKAKSEVNAKRTTKHEEKNDAMSIFNRAVASCSSSTAPKN